MIYIDIKGLYIQYVGWFKEPMYNINIVSIILVHSNPLLYIS